MTESGQKRTFVAASQRSYWERVHTAHGVVKNRPNILTLTPRSLTDSKSYFHRLRRPRVGAPASFDFSS